MVRFAARVLLVGAVIAAGSVSSSGCNNGSSTATTTAPSGLATTETFSGTVPQSGTTTYTFTVSVSNGTLSARLTSVGPLSTMALGVGVGSWDGATCTSIAKNDSSHADVTALTGIVVAGNYCVQVYHSGNIPDGSSATFTLQVAHF